eukprot:NODE_2497_length_916_cov_87.628604_g2052_i0.p1 GENE.NODE_2497_length_916_cov_87.628604_g2052_i0~~NODE_2497_length_916_cov_87.628604_g2052_i0.p1  ORF type:complete len:273 (+),score=45.69 NODE_2497_length_916_cov_87.628604_g2052_i0:38-856(+)
MNVQRLRDLLSLFMDMGLFLAYVREWSNPWLSVFACMCSIYFVYRPDVPLSLLCLFLCFQSGRAYAARKSRAGIMSSILDTESQVLSDIDESDDPSAAESPRSPRSPKHLKKGCVDEDSRPKIDRVENADDEQTNNGVSLGQLTHNPVARMQSQLNDVRDTLSTVQNVLGDLASGGERFATLLQGDDPRASAVFSASMLCAALVVYVVPLRVLVSIGILAFLRPPFLKTPSPPAPVSFLLRLPIRLDTMFHIGGVTKLNANNTKQKAYMLSN